MPAIEKLIFDFTARQAKQIADQAVDRAGTTGATLSSSVTETTIYSYDIKPDLMFDSRLMRLTILGSLFNNTGAPNGVTFRMKLNGVTHITDATLAAVASHGTDFTIIELQYIIAMRNSSASQSHFSHILSAKGAVGNGNVGAVSVGAATSAIDMTATKTMLVSAQMSANSANLIWTRNNSFLEYL